MPPLHARHGSQDADVARAAADVAAQVILHLLRGRVRRVLEQRGDGHDHARRAVAALEGALGEKGLLHGMEAVALGEPLHGDHLAAARLVGEHGAAAHGRAAQEHGARAADLDVARALGPREPEPIAQDVEEQLLGPRAHADLAAVHAHGELEGRGGAHAATAARRAARARARCTKTPAR